jgi:hypothetical protein
MQVPTFWSRVPPAGRARRFEAGLIACQTGLAARRGDQLALDDSEAVSAGVARGPAVRVTVALKAPCQPASVGMLVVAQRKPLAMWYPTGGPAGTPEAVQRTPSDGGRWLQAGKSQLGLWRPQRRIRQTWLLPFAVHHHNEIAPSGAPKI